MEIFTNWKNATPCEAQPSTLAIGNFDGMHLGHQALLEHAVELSQEKGSVPAVLSFSPHPRYFFKPDQAPFQLVGADQKIRLLKHFGIKRFFNLPFNSELAQLKAAEFIEQILVNTANVSDVIVGEDFRFGIGREGSVDTLLEASKKYGFKLHIIEPVCNRYNYVLSSTMIRDAIKEGELELANKMLGWPNDLGWEIEAEIIHGDKRGRELGYPTANMELGSYLRPQYGVYAVRIAIDDDSFQPKWFNGAANIGVRPMFEIPTPLLETFIFDFDQDIYGKTARVQLVQRLRGEKRFDSLDGLIKQMAKDCDQARKILG